MSKVGSFYWNKLSNKSFSFESEQLLICVLFGCLLGHLLSRKMNHNIMGKVQK